MTLKLEDKQALVAEVNAVAATAQSVVAAEYRGLSLPQMTELRAKARANGVYMRVVKNTLARRAVAGTPFECIGESLKGFEADSWFGLMMPAATPRAIVNKLNAEVQKILSLQDLKDRLLAQGGVIQGSTPEQMSASIRADIERWGKVIKVSGAKIE